MASQFNRSLTFLLAPILFLLFPHQGFSQETVLTLSSEIPKDHLEKIFQPFFTTKPTGQGTGLGLSLSYDIVTKMHGGELTVKTKEGERTTFIVFLPIT